MLDKRLQETIATIRTVVGDDEADEIQAKVRLDANRYSGQVSLGGRGLNLSGSETRRRSKVRAIMLVGMAKNQVATGQMAGLKQQLMGVSEAELDRRLKGLFPFKAFRGRFANRVHWDPIHFTDPTQHDDTHFRYITHGIINEPCRVAEAMRGNQSEEEKYQAVMQSYARHLVVENTRNPLKKNLDVKFYRQYLENPAILKQNIISTSVIDQDHRSTYYPFGFILRVPQSCVYSTHTSDQAVKNRTGDVVGELKRVHDQHGGKLLTPTEVLHGTSGRTADIGYNEVVVVGTSPEGRQVDVVGIYVKTDTQGRLFVRNSVNAIDTKPYVTPEVKKLITRCSRDHDIPIVFITDSSSGPSTEYWY